MRIAVDLACLLTPPLNERLYWLVILSRHGIEVVCQSFLDRDTTRKALRYVGFLEYLDDIHYEYCMIPEVPEKVNSKSALAILRKLKRKRRRCGRKNQVQAAS